MNKQSVKYLAYNAILAALYMVLTWINPISYGALQFRISTLIMPLPFFIPDLRLGILLGVMLANVNSPLGPVDILCGFCIQIMNLYVFNRFLSSPYARSVAYGIWAGIMVGTTLHFVAGAPYLASVIYVGISNIVFALLGTVLIEKALLKPVLTFLKRH